MATLARERHLSEYILYGRFVDDVLSRPGAADAESFSLCHCYWGSEPLTNKELESFIDDAAPSEVGVMVSAKAGMHPRDYAPVLERRWAAVSGSSRRRCRFAAPEERLVDTDVAEELDDPTRAPASTRSRPSRPMASRVVRGRRGAGGDRAEHRPRCRWADVDGRVPADTRVSFRSNATTGSSNAMYSIVLFIVETSFSGFCGSGHRPTSAVDRTSNDRLVGHAPRERDVVGDPELGRRAPRGRRSCRPCP